MVEYDVFFKNGRVITGRLETDVTKLDDSVKGSLIQLKSDTAQVIVNADEVLYISIIEKKKETWNDG